MLYAFEYDVIENCMGCPFYLIEKQMCLINLSLYIVDHNDKPKKCRLRTIGLYDETNTSFLDKQISISRIKNMFPHLSLTAIMIALDDHGYDVDETIIYFKEGGIK